jgi:carboxymethylenebutenolidase
VLGRAVDHADLQAVNEVYRGAAHGYTMADTSSYDEAATERHFAALEELYGSTILPR